MELFQTAAKGIAYMLKKLSETVKNNKALVSAIAVTFVALLVSSIMLKVPFIKALPLFISLVVMFLQANVSRYTFLLGAINSLIYAIPYYQMTLYSSMASTILTSFPFQLAAFIGWNKKTENNVTELKTLSWKKRGLLVLIMAAFWVALYFVFSIFGSKYMILDNTGVIIGIVASVLSVLRYMEFSIFQILALILSTALNIAVLLDDPTQLPYVLYNFYAAFCIVLSFIRMSRRTRLQLLRDEGHAHGLSVEASE